MMPSRRSMSRYRIGCMIRERRRELGMTQEDLATRLGITCQQVHRYEHGMNRLNVVNVQFLSEALQVPVSCFFSAAGPTGSAGDATPLTMNEIRLIDRFRQIVDETGRMAVIRIFEKATHLDSPLLSGNSAAGPPGAADPSRRPISRRRWVP